MSKADKLLIYVMLFGFLGGAAALAMLVLIASLFVAIPPWKGAAIVAAGSIVAGLVLGMRAQPLIKQITEAGPG